jgi:hypothetical protein
MIPVSRAREILSGSSPAKVNLVILVILVKELSHNCCPSHTYARRRMYDGSGSYPVSGPGEAEKPLQGMLQAPVEGGC